MPTSITFQLSNTVVVYLRFRKQPVGGPTSTTMESHLTTTLVNFIPDSSERFLGPEIVISFAESIASFA